VRPFFPGLWNRAGKATYFSVLFHSVITRRQLEKFVAGAAALFRERGPWTNVAAYQAKGEKAVVAPSSPLSSAPPAPVVVPPEKPAAQSARLSRQDLLEAADQLDIKPAKLRNVLAYVQEHNLV
jgi:hypothetical protein